MRVCLCHHLPLLVVSNHFVWQASSFRVIFLNFITILYMAYCQASSDFLRLASYFYSEELRGAGREIVHLRGKSRQMSQIHHNSTHNFLQPRISFFLTAFTPLWYNRLSQDYSFCANRANISFIYYLVRLLARYGADFTSLLHFGARFLHKTKEYTSKKR